MDGAEGNNGNKWLSYTRYLVFFQTSHPPKYGILSTLPFQTILILIFQRSKDLSRPTRIHFCRHFVSLEETPLPVGVIGYGGDMLQMNVRTVASVTRVLTRH